jgi:hypothetical protein
MSLRFVFPLGDVGLPLQAATRPATTTIALARR